MKNLLRVIPLAAMLLVASCASRKDAAAPAPDPEVLDPAAAAAILSAIESGAYGPLDEIGNTGVQLRLTPEPSDPEHVFILQAENAGTSPAIVEKIGLVQVGRISTSMTSAGESLSAAREVQWRLAPREKKELRLDLRELVFEGIKIADGTGPAMKFIEAIPRDDRKLIVVVWHSSAKWSGVQTPVRYPD